MSDDPGQFRLYTELAPWWPLISPPSEYAADAALVAKAFRFADGAVRDVLELGSGGGHHASHLARRHALTLVDISGEMLAVSARLNPGCVHIRGDMREIRLGRTFDATVILDAASYLTSEADLEAAVATAFAHCRPGGVAAFLPDHTAETFRPGTSHGGSAGGDGRAAHYLHRAWDPDPGDTWTLAEYSFVLREPGRPVRLIRETHRLGAFSRAGWLRVLGAAGFEPRVVTSGGSGPAGAKELFAGLRPRQP